MFLIKLLSMGTLVRALLDYLLQRNRPLEPPPLSALPHLHQNRVIAVTDVVKEPEKFIIIIIRSELNLTFALECDSIKIQNYDKNCMHLFEP